MPRLHTPLAAAILVAGLACPHAGAQAAWAIEGGLASGVVEGRVTAENESAASVAVGSARVYAYELADLTLHRVMTDDGGDFTFSSLPAGIYKIIAHKSGFEPVVVLLSRGSAAAKQYLEVQLERERAATGQHESFWSLREQVPPDVLREIESDERVAVLTEGRHSALDSHMRTTVSAMRGVSGVSGSSLAQRTVGSVGIETRLGDVKVGVNGNFSQIEPQSAPALPSSGAPGAAQTQAISVRVAGAQDQISLTGLSTRQSSLDGIRLLPVEYERYGVSWDRPVGESGHSQVTAQYTNESNFYKRGWVTPLAVPDFSQTLRVEGSYIETLSQDASLETGLRFRQRYGQFSYRNGTLINDTPDQSVDLFGRGTVRVHPAVLMEYGLYTTLRDGSVSLMPSGGVVLQLGSNWQASTSMAHRFHRGGESTTDNFMPVTFGESGATEPAESYLYKVEFTRHLAEDDSLSFGALDRQFDRSLRMYFSNDVFAHLENLFLVPGDRVPEVQASLSHRLSSQVTTRLESNYGFGGGGTVVGTQRRTYSNQVRYLVTSVNARFEPTSTGVFLSFRRVEQDLEPNGTNWVDPRMTSTDSLDLQLSQDLGAIFNLVGAWVVRLDVGLDRGASPYLLTNTNEDIRKRVLAGVAVQF